MVSGGEIWHCSVRSALRMALAADDHNFGETPEFPFLRASFHAALVAWWIRVSPAICLRRVNTRCAACWSLRTARTFSSNLSSRGPAEASAAVRAALEPLARTPWLPSAAAAAALFERAGTPCVFTLSLCVGFNYLVPPLFGLCVPLSGLGAAACQVPRYSISAAYSVAAPCTGNSM